MTHILISLSYVFIKVQNYCRKDSESKTCLWEPQHEQRVSFEYMNRQLVWNEFSVNLFLTVLFSHKQLVT